MRIRITWLGFRVQRSGFRVTKNACFLSLCSWSWVLYLVLVFNFMYRSCVDNLLYIKLSSMVTLALTLYPSPQPLTPPPHPPPTRMKTTSKFFVRRSSSFIENNFSSGICLHSSLRSGRRTSHVPWTMFEPYPILTPEDSNANPNS